MIITGIWFVLLAVLGAASGYSLIKMQLAHQTSKSLLLIVVVFIAALLVEAGLILILRSHVGSYKAYWDRPHQPVANELVYVAMGDSAAQGIGASSPSKGYVKLLADYMEAQTGRPVQIVNLSVSGSKLHDLISQQLPQLERLHPNIVTVDIGGNDIAAGTSPELMTNDYQQLTRSLRPYKTVFADLPDFMWGKRQHHTVSLNQTVNQLCSQNSLALADLNHKTHDKMWSLNEFAADGFHPNDAGHQTWASAFIPGVRDIISSEK